MGKKTIQNDLQLCCHLVLPLEFGPHGSEGLLAARSGLDVVHDIHVDVVEVDVSLLGGGTILVHDRAEDVAGLRAAHLHGRGMTKG